MHNGWTLAGLVLISISMGCNSEKKPVQAQAPVPGTSAAAASASLNLVGTEWKLEDLGGAGVVDNSQASLAFPEAGRVAGNGSCNRFTGAVAITGNSLKMSQLASTRMACLSEAVSNQENKYLKALEAATRYEWQDPYLLVYVEGMDKPLKFTRVSR